MEMGLFIRCPPWSNYGAGAPFSSSFFAPGGVLWSPDGLALAFSCKVVAPINCLFVLSFDALVQSNINSYSLD